MKHRGKNMATLLAGILVGMILSEPVANAATEFFQAQRSYQPVYVDGVRVELEAYDIGGYNYVKLRDIGQAVDFEVYWDGENVQIVSDQPYTGYPPTEKEPEASMAEDYSQEANPAIFVGELNRENYNAIRDTIVNREAILAGEKQPVPLGAFTPYGDIDEAAIAVGGYPAYEIVSQSEGYACMAKYPEAYKPAAEHTQSFIDGLAGKSDREKVTAITWYVADRITYAVKYPGPGKVLSQDGQIPGACAAYAYSFQFLCDRAGIPCILVRSETHQWNRIYLESQWWDVDVTGLDTGDDVGIREASSVLQDPSEMEGEFYANAAPEVTSFAMELLVPGSTK